MPIIETEQQTNQNVISGQEYLDAGATKELVGQLRGYAEGYNDGYDAGAAAGGGSGGSGSGSGNGILYCWFNEQADVYRIYTCSDTPNVNDKAYTGDVSIGQIGGDEYWDIIKNVASDYSTITIEHEDTTYTRSQEDDIYWNGRQGN